MAVNRVTYPCAKVPGPPTVSFDLPIGWTVSTAPGVAFLATKPAGVNEFSTNLVVSIRRVSSAVSLEESASEIGDSLKSLTDYAELTDSVVDIDDRPVAIREYGFVDSASGTTIFQIQAHVLVPLDRVTADVVTATLSHSSEELEQDLEDLRSIIRSMSVSEFTESSPSPQGDPT